MPRPVRTVLAVVAASLLAAACSSADPETATDPESQASASVVVRVGAAEPIQAEIAATGEARARGLMDRDRLAPRTGMVFVFPQPSTAEFYMFRTRVPLSIAFVDANRVVSVAEMTPCPAEDADDCPLYPADGPYTLAVEAPGGHFTSAGVRPGDPVEIVGDLPPADQ